MMKTKLYNLIVWTACLTMVSCTNQEIIEKVTKPVHNNTLNVVTENQRSRSVLDYEGTFYWTENDYIGVYGEETENAHFHFTSQADGVSVFTGNMNASGETVKWTYFPYSEEVKTDEKQLSFPMPSARTISNENHSPMIGRMEANNTVRFYHTGGILLLKIVGLPKQASQLVITSEGENSPCLAGTAVIDDINVDGCTYRIENGSKEVVYDTKLLPKDDNFFILYIPLQVGNYEKIRFTLKSEIGETIKEKTLTNLNISRARMTTLPTLNFSTTLYGYEIPNEIITGTGIDNGIIFSNDLLIGYNKETNKYIFIDSFDGINGENNFVVYLNDNNQISTLILKEGIIYFNNYTSSTVDVTLLFDGKIEEYKNVSYENSTKSRTEITREHWTNTANKICTVIDILPIIAPKKTITERAVEISSTMIGEITDNTSIKVGLGAATHFGGFVVLAFATGPVGIATGLFLVGYGAYNMFLACDTQMEKDYVNNQYEKFCGAGISTIEPQKIDESTFNTGYKLNMTQKIPDGLKNGIHECGLLLTKRTIGSYFNENSLKYTSNDNLEYLHTSKDLSNDRIEPISIPYQSGFTYYMRAYIAINKQGNSENPICYYSDIKKISFEDFKILEKTISECKYSNGMFHYKVNVKAECYTGKNWSLAIYKNGAKYRDEDFSSNTRQETEFEVKIARKAMSYSTKKTVDTWELALCTVPIYGEDGYNVKDYSPTVNESMNFQYDIEPSIDLDVRIIDGPRKVGGSRAADDEEEKYYVKYEVTANTKGSGWIEKVNIKVDGRSVKTGNPKNEGESFTYTGSKIYKNKSELPTISCEGILINGAGNIQSSPESISVASKVH